jgi:hypothetical protein
MLVFYMLTIENNQQKVICTSKNTLNLMLLQNS